jgi:hypothetical protein
VLPIVPHHSPSPAPDEVGHIENLACEIRDSGKLEVDEEFERLRVTELPTGGCLHLEDFSGLAQLRTIEAHIQGRARMRAADGDVVCGSLPMPDGYESYCRDWLRLGAPERLEVRTAGDSRQLASLCWRDREARRALIRRLRAGELSSVHPYMGSHAVWELALLLQRASRQAVGVIGPHPRLCRWVNDKGDFTETVRRAFGERWVCETRHVSSLAKLSSIVRGLKDGNVTIGFKIPNASGGDGNLVVTTEQFDRQTARETQHYLKRLLLEIGWRGQQSLLVCAWETEVLSSPSVQLWIPPSGDPIVEGVFEQMLTGPHWSFAGSRPARLPASLTREIVNRSWLLSRLYQLLGYVGRCSFDLLIAGEDWDRSRIEFVECNGRWGGTSLPMTLMNRIFGDWAVEPYLSCSFEHPVLGQMTFAQVMEALGDDLYDAGTREGRLILFNPQKLAVQAGLDLIVRGRTEEEAGDYVREVLPGYFNALGTRRSAGSRP